MSLITVMRTFIQKLYITLVFIDSSGIMANLSKWLYVAMAIFSFPLMIAPARSAISNLSPIHLSQSTSTIFIVSFSLILSLFIKNLSLVIKE